MDLSGTETVVLSGCKTGRGPAERYLGLVDLRRAARIAGCTRVIVALWNVPDVATALLMRLLYTHTGAQAPTEADLSRAQKDLRSVTTEGLRRWLSDWQPPSDFGGPYLKEILLQNPAKKPFADPYYWAGFVCYTTGRSKRLPE